MEKDKEEIIDPVVDDNTVVDDEVVDTMPDETLAQTDEVIPAPVDPVLPEIPIDTIPASTSEPLTVEEPVDSDVVPGAGDELPTDIAEPVDVPVEEPIPGECPNCEGEGCPVCDGNSIANLFGTMQEAVTIIWKYHLKTRKYSVHIALNDFYDKMLDLVDDVIEQYQGIHGIIEDVFTNCVCDNGTSEYDYLNNLRAYIENNKGLAGTESEIQYNPLDLFESCDFEKKQRSKVKQPRSSNKDNIRRVVKRRFDNTHLKNTFNKKLKKAGYKNFIECFPQEFAGNVTREINSSIINMTFGQILTDKSIYSGKKLYQYENNLEIVNLIKKDQNSDLNAMLNKKFSELFEEYLNSDEFKIGEIQRLLNATKPKSGNYIQKYKYLARNLINFFTDTD